MAVRFNRRDFIKTLGAGTLGAMAWGSVPGLGGLAHAQSISRKRLVIVLADGGADGMDWGVYDIAEAAARRPDVQRASAELINMGHSYVKLTGNLGGLYSARASNFALFSCVAEPGSSGSHEQARLNAARGVAAGNQDLSDSFLGRMLGQLNAINPSPFLGWGFSNNDRENLAARDYHAIITGSNLAQYSFTADTVPGFGGSVNESAYRDWVIKTNLKKSVPAANTVQSALLDSDEAIHNSIVKVKAANAQFGTRAGYPNNAMGNTLKTVATLIAADMGQVFVVRGAGGHDTHSNQITNNNNSQATYNASLLAFTNDLISIGEFNNTLVMCTTEFGRQIGSNSTAGTDHGWGKTILALGGAVKGGVHGPVATPAQIAKDFALPRALHPNVLIKDITEWMGLDVPSVLPQPFQDQHINWI